ncbi:C4-dicarboxylate ABC transporter permease (plasmid) [Vibrio nigripulchritudo]|uniref:TRAP transporter small permease n=1 Tax=Vibrio nigripulchritudo TaxID=28173 RepID=UPI0019097E3C|nr:TRAP transporter small permease subunit [Vibrio nigripulchritudo]BCL73727.1 C4-dicarboxylate ABC transporter permease [Vibrio nigripulchritudo]BDU35102.1 C4-dicarboxylate ABC transporter permease [Vibrio nigripulchritudo]
MMNWINRLVKVESVFVSTIVASIVGLITLNVATRALGVALYWVDELVIYLMIWMVLFSMPLLIHLRQHIFVNILTSVFTDNMNSYLMCFVDLIVLVVSLLLLYWSYNWFSIDELYAYGFDTEEFSKVTFNFIYDEPTNTLEIKKVFFWSAIPLSVLLCVIHSSVNFFYSAWNSIKCVISRGAV